MFCVLMVFRFGPMDSHWSWRLHLRWWKKKWGKCVFVTTINIKKHTSQGSDGRSERTLTWQSAHVLPAQPGQEDVVETRSFHPATQKQVTAVCRHHAQAEAVAEHAKQLTCVLAWVSEFPPRSWTGTCSGETGTREGGWRCSDGVTMVRWSV